jgi:hypothetical protein
VNVINKIVTLDACNRTDVAKAVEFWFRPSEYSGGEPISRTPAMSLPEPDKIVSKLKAPTFPDSKFGDSYEFSPDTVTPLQTRYDVSGLVKMLKNGECETKGPAANSLITALARNTEIRRRMARKNSP